jgi:hypothetical protein
MLINYNNHNLKIFDDSNLTKLYKNEICLMEDYGIQVQVK